MIEPAPLIERVQRVQHGFADIRDAAAELIGTYAADQCFALAVDLLGSDVYQARMLATELLGHLAADDHHSFALLHDQISRDPNWRVQEMLARAFDRYCATTGYEAALPTMEAWLGDDHPNVRRAAAEGPRIWTTKPYFRDHPAQAVALLAPLHADDSEYVRKSVGNALRDVSRKHAALVQAAVEQWDRSDPCTAQTYTLASKFLQT